MKITNKYTATVILPPNEPVHRGQSINYQNWDAIKDMPNIAWYVENGLLVVEDAEYVAEPTQAEIEDALDELSDSEEEDDGEEEPESEPNEKTKLIADLAELGVEVDGRTGLKKLRAMLDEKLAEQQ